MPASLMLTSELSHYRCTCWARLDPVTRYGITRDTYRPSPVYVSAVLRSTGARGASQPQLWRPARLVVSHEFALDLQTPTSWMRFGVQLMCHLPGINFALRVGMRLVVHQGWPSLRNKQRLYNFFAPELVPSGPVSFEVRNTGGRPIRVKQELSEWKNSRWY